MLKYWILSVYFCLSVATNLGIGVILPVSLTERAIAVIIMTSCFVASCYILGNGHVIKYA